MSDQPDQFDEEDDLCIDTDYDDMFLDCEENRFGNPLNRKAR